MKTTIVTIILVILFIDLKAQLFISTQKRTDAYFDDNLNEYVTVSTDDSGSLFKINNSFNSFEHTTSNLKSTYYINDYVEDKERNRWEMNIVSDVGNKYLMIIDLKNNNLRFIYTKDGVTWAVQHEIKTSWIEK